MLAVPFLQAWPALVVIAMGYIDDRAGAALVAFCLDPLHGITWRAKLEWRRRFSRGRFEDAFARVLELADKRSLFAQPAGAA